MKPMKNNLVALLTLAWLSTLNSELSTLHAQGTAFTYQGRLQDGANAASGTYDLKFTLFDRNSPRSSPDFSGITSGSFSCSTAMMALHQKHFTL